jgi:hypothetical protein
MTVGMSLASKGYQGGFGGAFTEALVKLAFVSLQATLPPLYLLMQYA